jgi:excinuclease ABC subunit C
MDVASEASAFAGFGPDPFNPHPLTPLQHVSGRSRRQLRAAVASSAPRLPGVYGMLDRDERLIYVGKSKRLASRLLSYFNPSSADEKAGRIVDSARTIVWETGNSEFAALLREQQLIRRWQPRWNVQGLPKRQRPQYLCVGRAPAPSIFLSRLPPRDCLACEGPFFGAERMRRAVDVLNKFFRLRDCNQRTPMIFGDQLPLFDFEHRAGCLRYELGTCLGPCAGACSRQQYERQVAAAADWLREGHPAPMEGLQDQMERAATTHQFELAGRIRDDLVVLDYLHRKLKWMANARQRFSFTYACGGQHGPATWYLIIGGEISDTLVAPVCPNSYQHARQHLRRWQRQIDASRSTMTGAAQTRGLVAAWFRGNRDELKHTFAPRDASRRYQRLARA